MLRLLKRAATRGHRLANVATTSARVSLGALITYRETASVTFTTLCMDVFETLDVVADLTAQLTLDREPFGERTNLLLFIACKFAPLLL